MNPISSRDMIIETNRDVKWIRAAISDIRQKESMLDERVRTLELNYNNSAGLTNPESKSGSSSLLIGAGAGAGCVTSFLIKILFG